MKMPIQSHFRSQRGFSLVATIFILVILSVLGGYMSVMSINLNQQTALSVQGVRAEFAAASGMNWAADYVIDNASCPSPIPRSITVDGESDLEGFDVELTACSKTDHVEAGDSYSIYSLSVTAERGSYGDVDYVQRSLTATVGS
jgi:MSHA biogenesis protein MshP